MSMRRWATGIALFLGLLLLALSAASPVQAEESSPEGLVFNCLTDAGYEVLDVYGDDEAAMVVMEPVSEEWDDDLGTQVVWGWFCLYPTYGDLDLLLSAVEFGDRYYLAFFVDGADFGDWLDGEMSDTEFASAYTYGVYDTQIGDWISETDFLHTYFRGAEPSIDEEDQIPRPGQQGGEPVFSDDFSDDDSGLPEDEDDNRELVYANDEYQIHIFSDAWSSWVWYADLVLDDFTVQVQARLDDGSPEGDYGIIIRVGPGGDDFYNFAISADGRYNIYKHDSDGWTELVGFARDSAIQGDGEWDLLRIEAEGPTMSFFVNGEPLATVEDDDFSSGTIGFYAATYEDPEMSVAFDDLVVWTGEAPSEGWSLVLEDDFSDDYSGFTRHEEDDTSELGYEDDEYHIAVFEENQVRWAYSGDAEFDDLAVEVRARLVEGDEEGCYGLLVRADAGTRDFYRFGISADGQYSIFRYSGGRWTDLVDWTESPDIEGDGEWDLLRVEAVGSELSFLVNGELLTTAEDDELDSGRIGLHVGTYDDPELRVAFDDLKVYALEGPPTGEPTFGPVTWYEYIDEDGNVEDPVTEYPRGSSMVIANWEFANMEDGLEWGYVWLYEGDVIVDKPDYYEWTAGQDGTWTTYLYTTEGTALDSGEYEIELYLEGEKVQSATARVR
jgi:hypothetical protein